MLNLNIRVCQMRNREVKSISRLPLFVLLMLSSLMITLRAEPLLTPKEQSWIRAHPQVYYSVKDLWPQETVRNGVHNGISREVLDAVSRSTGITFIYVSPAQAQKEPVMMVSAVNGSLLTDVERNRWLLTFPWANTMPMIVSKKDAVQVRTLTQLQGKQIAVVKDSDFTPWIQRHFPSIHLNEQPDILSALQSVETGNNDAVIASGLVMLPILQRHYLHRLAIVAQIPEMASGISIAVNPAYPELQTILNKSMEQVTAGDAQEMFARWIGIVDIGTPTLSFVVWQYRYPVLVIVSLIVLLLVAIRFALVSRRKALRSEQHKSEFLAVMSHEIRTPMNAIIAALEMLKHADKPAQNSQYIELAYSSSQDLLDLLNSVLDHEKVSHTHLNMQLESIEPGVLIEAVCNSQRPAAQHKGLSLEFNDTRPDPSQWIMMDAHRLRQIVNNLLSNAIKFTELGGISVHMSETDHALILTVQDTGSGISASVQKRLMQAWQQGEHLAGGSGLGLYICQSLVKQMQGTMDLVSEDGKGTRVCISLPLHRAAPTDSTVNVDTAIFPDFSGACSVLVVEDHVANRQLITDQLTLLGCYFEIAEDGESVLSLLEEENYYDIILLDCGLPGLDGYSVAQRIRDIEQLQHREAMTIIAISAQSSSQHIARCLKSGMNDVLAKPIRLRNLADALQKWYLPVGNQLVKNNNKIPLREDIWLALQEDTRRFIAYTEQKQIPWMLHYIHRIKGVAQMYQIENLADYASLLEEKLQAGLPTECWEPELWVKMLNELTVPRP
jgi:two-component system sensor histidine kinase EvgS